jgi:hypothetical protein
MYTKSIILCTAIILGISSTALSAAPNESGTGFQQCMANLQASGRNFGGNSEESGMTRYDEMAARCIERLYWRR